MKNIILKNVLLLLMALILNACGGGPDLNELAAASAGTSTSGTTSGSTGTTTVPPPPPLPNIVSFTPTSGTVGTTITIIGTDFDAIAVNNTVKFNGTAATVTAASATSLTVTVPTAATSGTISVATTAGIGTSATIFTVHGPGILSGDVRDAVTNASLSGVTATIAGEATPLTTDINGIYTTTLMDGLYSLDIVYPGYISAHISNFAVAANVTNTVETVQLVEATPQYSGVGTVSGTVKNAFNGLGLSSVTLNFRSGINTTTGTILSTTTTAADGTFTESTLAGGNYTAEAVLAGYTTGYFTVTSVGGLSRPNQDGTITPVLPPGETRIILTWGPTPFDLDSHLSGPVSGSISRFHVYYGSRGSNTATPFANLDVDDTYSYGPETTTIYQQTAGTYRFSVHDFSNRSSTSSFALSASKANVRIYNSTGLVATYNVPINQAGTLWTVFEMNGNTIIPISTLSNSSSPGSIP